MIAATDLLTYFDCFTCVRSTEPRGLSPRKTAASF
jgi:hypothetical protein